MRQLGLILMLIACTSRGDDTTSTSGDTASTGATSTTADTGERPVGPWTLRTTVLRADDLDAAADEGLCAALYKNPDGPKDDPFTSTTLGKGGELLVTGIETTSKDAGVLVELNDCKGQPTTVLRSVTGILPQHFDSLRLGDEYDHPTFVMSAVYEAQIRAGLDTLGAPLDPGQGFVFGFVRDPNGDPIGGATVTIEESAGPLVTYYADGNPDDGLFGSGTTANSVTIDAGAARWIVPVGPVASLSASHPDYQFAPQANISLPLQPRAVFVTFVGVPL